MSKILETALNQSTKVTNAAFDLRSKYGHHAAAQAQRMVDFNKTCQDQDGKFFWLAVLAVLNADDQATLH